METKTIQEWSVDREGRGDEPVYILTKPGRNRITLRFQAGTSEEEMDAQAETTIAVANFDFFEKFGKNAPGERGTFKQLERRVVLARLKLKSEQERTRIRALEQADEEE